MSCAIIANLSPCTFGPLASSLGPSLPLWFVTPGVLTAYLQVCFSFFFSWFAEKVTFLQANPRVIQYLYLAERKHSDSVTFTQSLLFLKVSLVSGVHRGGGAKTFGT